MDRSVACALGAVLTTVFGASTALAGAVNPPAGPIAPTPGPEPRIAINATNTPGDDDSIYRITQPGSYYLTGNVTGVNAKHGIEIAANGVAVDLMGYELVGVPGSGCGVRSAALFLTNIQIRNGSVRAWGDAGIELGTLSVNGGVIESIVASGNASHGIVTGNGFVVSRCAASSNGVAGFYLASRAAIVDCAAYGNTDSGIGCGAGCTITSCTMSENGDDGLEGGVNTTVAGCSAHNNGAHGISTSSVSSVASCTAYSNGEDGINSNGSVTIIGCTVSGNSGDGMQMGANSLVSGNDCGANVGAAIHCASSDCRIEGNNCVDSGVGILVDFAGNVIVRNTCSGNGTNWSVVANNYILVISGVAGGAINGDSGGASLGSTNPNANFTY